MESDSLALDTHGFDRLANLVDSLVAKVRAPQRPAIVVVAA
jgi:hypothetical protein